MANERGRKLYYIKSFSCILGITGSFDRSLEINPTFSPIKKKSNVLALPVLTKLP
jgi:hypothetical protein